MTAQTHPGWLYSKTFDGLFIYGNVALAVVAGLTALHFPLLAPTVVFINLWALGYHHVIGTFTRLCFDKQSHRRSILLIYALLPAVMGLVLLLSHVIGLWVIASVYLYGQWFHYARQSWGISRAYERNAPKSYVADRSWQTQAAFYSFPAFGILYRSWQGWDLFLGLPIKMILVPFWLVLVAGAVSLFFFGLWLVRIYKDWKAGSLPRAYAGFMASHFFTFFFAYIIMPTLDSGWLVANIWHNLQYLMFVWLFNNRTYRNGIDPQAHFLSTLSQRQNMVIYFAITLLISTLIYLGVNLTVSGIGLLSAIVIIYMTINFHHYIVDAIIWRVSWIKRGQASKTPVPPPTP